MVRSSIPRILVRVLHQPGGDHQCRFNTRAPDISTFALHRKLQSNHGCLCTQHKVMEIRGAGDEPHEEDGRKMHSAYFLARGVRTTAQKLAPCSLRKACQAEGGR